MQNIHAHPAWRVTSNSATPQSDRENKKLWKKKLCILPLTYIKMTVNHTY